MTRLLLLLLLSSSAALAQPAPQMNTFDPATAPREHELALQLRCLVCQNQTIADSNAPLAADLRNRVREQIAAGKTDREIIDYMTARYGDFVLYRPPFKATTALLWLGPLLLLVAGAVIALRVVRSRRAAQAPLTAAEHENAQRLLGGEGHGA